jgi:tetratricopeptide (TPR) repeat protein
MMMQASTSPASFFLGIIFQMERPSQVQFKMCRYSGTAAFVLVMGCLWSGPITLAQQSKATAISRPVLTPENAVNLAEQGRCRESLSGLKRAMGNAVAAELRKQAGVLGIRCSLAVDDRESADEFIRLLNKQFSKDPDVLFIIIHAYSDLSTRTAQDLGRTAPDSFAAHKLNAEALEMQGRWEPAQLEYEGMIQKDPNARGIHFLLARLLLSRPDAGPDAPGRAKQELLKEIKIDASNVDAHYILGELARRDENWDEAISRFSQAAKLNPNFAEAYLGWGLCLVTVKKYEDAIPPLRTAERLTPGNPEVHHTLATALERSGHKEEAEKEFAIHRSLSSAQGPERPE